MADFAGLPVSPAGYQEAEYRPHPEANGVLMAIYPGCLEGYGMRQNPCPIPGCQRNRQVTSKYGLCAPHSDLVETVLWVLNNMVRQKNAPSSGLVVPGSPDFQRLPKIKK